MKIETMEVTASLGQVVYEEMVEAHYLTQKDRRKQTGWSMSGHAYLSLCCWLASSMKQMHDVRFDSVFMGHPIFIHDSAQLFQVLYATEEASRLEYEARQR